MAADSVSCLIVHELLISIKRGVNSFVSASNAVPTILQRSNLRMNFLISAFMGGAADLRGIPNTHVLLDADRMSHIQGRIQRLGNVVDPLLAQER